MKVKAITQILAIIVTIAFFAYHAGYAIGKAKAHHENSQTIIH
ncbi:hypothetical protein [Mongoliitalea daihaiensis]|nr:hypothetical protein [Mongoliitalea daihaiensis]